MGSPAGERQRPDACGCAHDLDRVADLLRQALEVIEGPRSYTQGIADWEQQARTFQRRQRPQQRASAAGGQSAPRAAHPHLTRGGQS